MALDLNAIKTANQSANARWTAGDTSMTKLPNDQSRRLRLGYNPGPGEPSLAERETQAKANLQAYLARAAAPAPAYPRAIDWRNKGGFSYVSSVKDQGNCGSCVAFGTAAAIEATARINRNIPVNGPNAGVLEDVSEAQLFYCGAGQACSVGWYVSAALDYSTQNGLVPASSYRYTAGDQPCRLPNDWQSNITKVSESHTIASYEDMKSVLANHGPLITCFTVYEDFFAYQSGVYHHLSGDAVAGHCVCCIGYDENVQAWLCKNSWGKDWGEGGYFWIAYGECGIDGTMWAVDAFSSIYSRTAVPGSALASMGFGGSNDPRVYYLGAGRHVHELAWFNGWHHRDITADGGGYPSAAKSTLTAMGYGDSHDPRLYSLTPDNHVQELAWFNGGWHHLDLIGPLGG